MGGAELGGLEDSLSTGYAGANLGVNENRSGGWVLVKGGERRTRSLVDHGECDISNLRVDSRGILIRRPGEE